MQNCGAGGRACMRSASISESTCVCALLCGSHERLHPIVTTHTNITFIHFFLKTPSAENDNTPFLVYASGSTTEDT